MSEAWFVLSHVSKSRHGHQAMWFHALRFVLSHVSNSRHGAPRFVPDYEVIC